MHRVKHIRKMNVKLTVLDKNMVSLGRKQIPVCKSCHVNIHAGKYDGIALKDVMGPVFIIKWKKTIVI